MRLCHWPYRGCRIPAAEAHMRAQKLSSLKKQKYLQFCSCATVTLVRLSLFFCYLRSLEQKSIEQPNRLSVNCTSHKPAPTPPKQLASPSMPSSSLPSSIPTSVTEVKEALPSTAEVKEDVVEATKSSLQSLRALAAGGVGGICAVIVGHPFDLVKVRMQTAEKGVYSGAMDVVRKTIAREGLARVRSEHPNPILGG